MDVLAVTASLIACIQLASTLAKRLGPSSRDKDDLTRILATLCSFHGALEGLKTYMEFNAQDSARMTAMQHLDQPLQDCKDALDMVNSQLKSVKLVGKYIVGKFWDGKLDKCLKKLDEAKQLLELSMHSDLLLLAGAIEKYVQNLAEDVRDISQVINENGKRLLGVDETLQQAKRWQMRADSSLAKLDERMLAVGEAEQIRHVDIKMTIQQTGLEQQEEEVRKEVLRWLAHTDPNTNLNDACERRDSGTGLWFLNGDAYRQWKLNPQSFLWLHGPAGCGKTVLSSTIIQDLERSVRSRESSGVANFVVFYYFSFTDIKKRRSRNLLYSILLQIVQRLPKVPSAVTSLHEDYRHGEPPISKVLAAVKAVLSMPGQTYLVIDALDECPREGDGRRDMFSRLNDILAWNLRNLHIIATSRKESDIEAHLIPLTRTSAAASAISLRPEEIDIDIRISVQKQLNMDVFSREWLTDLKDDVQQALIEGAKGSFRWVSCQLKELENCSRPSQVRTKLKLLPKTLDDTYERILLKIDQRLQPKAIMILQWLAFSERTLRIGEVGDAIFEAGSPAKTTLPDDARSLLGQLSSLVVITKRFLTSDDYDWKPVMWKHEIEEVSLAHFSVKEYLSSQRILTGEVQHFHIGADWSHAAIAQRCLECLLLFREPESLSKQSLKEKPLLHYAANMWYKHIRAIPDGSVQESTTKLCLSLLNSKTDTLRNWLRISDSTLSSPLSYSEIPVNISRVSARSPLYVAAYCGLMDATRQLLSRDAPLDRLEKTKSLLAAASKGHTAIAGLLLDVGGINVNSRNENGTMALHRAAKEGHEETVAFLLKRNARVNAKDRLGNSALHLAASLSDETVARLLLENGARVEYKNRRGKTALHVAANADSTAVVRLLLERNAQANAVADDGSTPFQNAALSGSANTLGLLLTADVNIDGLDQHGDSALSIATWSWNAEAVEYLLNNGARKLFVDSLDVHSTLLGLAKCAEAEAVGDWVGQYDVEVNQTDATLRILLDRGFGVPEEFQELLSLAARQGWNRVAEFLISNPNVNPFYQDDKGNTILHTVIETVRDIDLREVELNCPWCMRLLSTLRALIEKAGIDIATIPNHDSKCAFVLAAKFGWEGAIILMIQLSAPYNNIKPPFASSWTHHAAEWHMRGVLKTLGDHGEDMNLTDDQGRMPVHLIFNGFEPYPCETIEILLKYGAKLQARDAKQQTILHHWVQDSAWDEDEALKIARFLLNNGAELNAQDENGLTAIELWEELDTQGERCDVKILTALETVGGELGLL